MNIRVRYPLAGLDPSLVEECTRIAPVELLSQIVDWCGPRKANKFFVQGGFSRRFKRRATTKTQEG